MLAQQRTRPRDLPTIAVIDDTIAQRLRRRRRFCGKTQQELGARVGVRAQQIQKYECGANRVSAGKLWLIAQVLGVDIGYFYEGLCDTTNPR